MTNIRIAIQKSGRLNEDSLKILKECGISIDNGKDQLKASSRNFPMEVFYLRNGDIPQYLKDGVVDIAIIGPNVPFEEDQLYALVVGMGGEQPSPEDIVPGCGFEGMNVHTNFIDASKRNEEVSWEDSTLLPDDYPEFKGGANTLGSITFRQYFKGTDEGEVTLTRPVIVVRDLQTGKAVPREEVLFEMGLLFYTDETLIPTLDMEQIFSLIWYNQFWLPRFCYEKDPLNELVFSRGTEHVQSGHPHSGYLSAPISSEQMNTVLTEDRFIRMRLKLPQTSGLPEAGKALRSTNEELRYISTSLIREDTTTIASISDIELARNDQDYATVIFGVGSEVPEHVTKDNGYTYFDLTEMEGYETLRTIAMRTVLPASSFCGSGEDVPFRMTEHNPVGGFMGPYAPVVDFPLGSELPTLAPSLNHPDTCGILPTTFPEVCEGNDIPPFELPQDEDDENEE